MSRFGERRSGRTLGAGLALAGALAAAADGADLSGGARITVGTTDDRGVESDTLEQQYRFDLFQEITPYLSLRFGYLDSSYDADRQLGASFSRRNQAPSLDVLYRRPTLTARLSADNRYLERSTTSDFEVRSLSGSLGWQPDRGPGYELDFRDETNVADEDVFGRNADTRLLGFRTYYSGGFWGASYSFRRQSFDNRAQELTSVQDRHDLQAQALRRFLGERLTLSASGTATWLKRDTQAAGDFTGAEALPVTQGLAAVDTSPEVGELDPTPGLIDGDVDTPVAPGIDIGGANTFRNLGVDLGLTRPVSRIQVWVDNTSGAGVLWQAFHSRDNLVWERIDSVVSQFETDFQRYSISFAETTSRYFKVVNISANPVAEVRVTEVRAQVEFRLGAGDQNLETTIYQVAAAATYRPNQRVTAKVDATWGDDQDLSGGFVRRGFETQHIGAQILVQLLEHLRLSAGYRLDDSEENRQPVLIRHQKSLDLSLQWTPLPTFDALLTAYSRSESDEDRLIQSNRAVQLRVRSDLWPGFVGLVSDLGVSQLEDPFTGLTRDSRFWRESLSLRPTPQSRLEVFYGQTINETFSGEPQLERSEYGFLAAWSPTAFLSLSGSWSISDQDGQENVHESFHLSYAPGPKLRITAGYQEQATTDLRSTGTDSLAVRYRLNPRFGFFGNLSRSTTGGPASAAGEITTLRIGSQLSF